jgi:integrase/recombinase XerD
MDPSSSRPAHGHDAGIDVVMAAWLASQPSANTRSAYRTDLEAFTRWCAAGVTLPLQADMATIVAFQSVRAAAGDSPSTLRRRWSSLSSFFQFAVDADVVDVNPVEGAERPRVVAGERSPTDLLTGREVEAYLEMANALDPRLDALVSLLAYDGLKLGEALALDVDDVSGRPPKVSLTIRRNGRTKTALDARSARAVHRCAGRRGGEPLFTSGTRSARATVRRLSRFGADHLLRQLSAGGHERVTANELRRYFVQSACDAGATEDEVRERSGLADVRGVRRYLRSDDDRG